MALSRSMTQEWNWEAMEVKSTDMYTWYSEFHPGRVKEIAWMVFPKAMTQSPWLVMALDCLGTRMESWKRSPGSWDYLASISEEWAPRTLAWSTTYPLTMLSHWLGGKVWTSWIEENLSDNKGGV